MLLAWFRLALVGYCGFCLGVFVALGCLGLVILVWFGWLFGGCFTGSSGFRFGACLGVGSRLDGGFGCLG